ncbi:glycosyltransferase family 1 protein [Poseidonocella sp. HB161398]|uniref:glycosyltransferase family 4 protein n=1 Tax=Poseidonocella sp. HB161398 TaxID=2320855 RepID=UPI0011088EBA|nr:glycosyltransferase family 1 protein [Poseidonocella sp. HB161398]
MTVAYFANQFADSHGHGLARYARDLFDALQSDGGPEDDRIVPVAGWSSLPSAALEERQRETGLRMTGLGRQGTKLAWTFLNRPSIETCLGGGIDIVHAVSLGYPVATRRPLVVTVHDLGPLTHPEFFRNTRPWVMERSLAQAVEQAHTIVCVSESTAREVRERAGPGVEDRLRVVLEGVSPRFFAPADPETLTGLDLPPPGTPFILSAGQISPRKNFQGLARAMRHAIRDIPHHLVLVGGPGWDSPDFRREMEDEELRRRVHLPGFVSDDALRALYDAAALYVHPSLYEGFGLPVLEAMASGTPVVASDASALPEVVGTAGRLVDATDPEAMAAAIVEVCSSEETLAKMAAEGRAHAARFTWAEAARQMREVYRDARS